MEVQAEERLADRQSHVKNSVFYSVNSQEPLKALEKSRMR